MELSEAELIDIGKALFVSSIVASITPDDPEKITRWCYINKQKYTDQDFPPSRISLIKNPKTSEKVKAWKKFEWRRATDFLTDAPVNVFVGGITPDDIRQGALGDTYFLCALTLLAEKPSRIEKLFITKDPSEWGVYAVELCVHGEKKVVVVDDFFPCTGPTGGPCFSKANGSELWVMILEKAWAKVYGSYERTERGTSNGALRDLTGAPTVTYKFEEGTWEKIIEGIREEYIICASASSNKASQQILEGIGLIGSLSYAVLKAQEVKTSEGPVKLVMLRNPWSNAEWQGDWSDKSPKWTPQLKKLLDFTEEEDGTFWMNYEDFKDYFSAVTICQINDHYVYRSFKTKHAKESHIVLKLEVTEPGQTYVSVDQMEQCCFFKGADYKYSNCRMIIAKESHEGLVYIAGKQGFDRNLWVKLNLERGNYQVYVEFEWVSIVKQFVLSTYGSSHLKISSLGEVPTYLREVYINRANVSGVEVTVDHADGLIKYHEMLPEGFGYFYIYNGSAGIIKETCYFKTFKNLALLPPHTGAKYDISLEPEGFEIVLIKVTTGQKPVLKFTSTVHAEEPPNPLFARIKKEGNPEPRLHPETNEALGITVFILKHESGMYLLYENMSKTVRFEEDVEFTLRNAKIVGVTGKAVSVDLAPGKSQLVEIQSISKSWSVQRSSSFAIS